MDSVPFLTVVKQVEIIRRIARRINMNLLVTILSPCRPGHANCPLARNRLFNNLYQFTGLNVYMAEALTLFLVELVHRPHAAMIRSMHSDMADTFTGNADKLDLLILVTGRLNG